MKSKARFGLGRFELTSKSVQTFPKSYAGRIRDGSTFAYKSKDWSKMIKSRICINGSSDAKFCQLSNGTLAFCIRNLVMEQNGFFWLDPISFHGFLDVRKKLSKRTVCYLWWTNQTSLSFDISLIYTNEPKTFFIILSVMRKIQVNSLYVFGTKY